MKKAQAGEAKRNEAGLTDTEMDCFREGSLNPIILLKLLIHGGRLTTDHVLRIAEQEPVVPRSLRTLATVLRRRIQTQERSVA